MVGSMFGSVPSQRSVTSLRLLTTVGWTAVAGAVTWMLGSWYGPVLTYSTLGPDQALAVFCGSTARTRHQCVVLSASATGTIQPVLDELPSITLLDSAASR